MGLSFLGEHQYTAELVSHSIVCAHMPMGYQWGRSASVYFLIGDDDVALQALVRAGDSIFDIQGRTVAVLARRPQ